MNRSNHYYFDSFNENFSSVYYTEYYNMGNLSVTQPLMEFQDWYRPVHGYLATIVCVLGVIANVLNIIVLTRKNMISATNIILTGLAIFDGITMAFYLAFALKMYVIHGTDVSVERDTEKCAQFQLSFAIVSVICHSISIWLTVTLAVFRYVFIRYPRVGSIYCNVRQAKIAVVAVAIVISIVCIPNAITYKVTSGIFTNITNKDGNGTTEAYVWWVDVKSSTTTDVHLQKFNFWIQAIFVKLLPCFLLTIFSILLICTMQDVENRRRQMMTKTAILNQENQPLSSSSKRSRRSQRTTMMLLVVVILFIVTETPQGILNLLAGVIDNFFQDVYMPLGDLMDILALINNGINFVLYCTMSKQFRDTFMFVFCQHSPRLLKGRTLAQATTFVTTKETDV